MFKGGWHDGKGFFNHSWALIAYFRLSWRLLFLVFLFDRADWPLEGELEAVKQRRS